MSYILCGRYPCPLPVWVMWMFAPKYAVNDSKHKWLSQRKLLYLIQLSRCSREITKRLFFELRPWIFAVVNLQRDKGNATISDSDKNLVDKLKSRWRYEERDDKLRNNWFGREKKNYSISWQKLIIVIVNIFVWSPSYWEKIATKPMDFSCRPTLFPCTKGRLHCCQSSCY